MAEEKSPSAKASEDKKEAKEEKKSASTDASQGGDVKVPEKFKKLVDEVEKMSVLDLSELVSILEDKFGVSAAAPMAIAAAPGAVGEESVAEEKSEFDIELTAAGDQKINAIKAVREATGLGLKDAKDLVDAAPKVIKEKVAKEEAEETKKKLEEAGATVTLK